MSFYGKNFLIFLSNFILYKKQLEYIFFQISCKYFQNFCTEGIFALSSGECAPLIVGPKLTISIFG